ncbi:MAG: alpha/beta hydrolase [Actinobacteria bacterium]|nr:MAG: alpha/beta hydrolase [Actinomycetota bacterium]
MCVELAALLVQRFAAGRLLPFDDARDALHVADDLDAHPSSLRAVSASPSQSVTGARLELHDGRILAWREYGSPDGRPILRFQGTPGSRNSRHPHEDSYARLDVRVIVADRPGYGESTRLPKRGISIVADDAAQLLDHLGLDRVHVIGGSGGGPHALAFAARHPERARAVTVVVGGVPLEEADTVGLIGLNRAGWYAAREGWDAMFELLAPVREELLHDPLAQFRSVMDATPESDRAVMEDPDWQRVFLEDVTEALRPGAKGWADEGIALLGSWDFDPADVRCSVTWWHGENDANSPIVAVRRLVSSLNDVDLRVWDDSGHLEPFRRHDEIIEELLSR